MEIKEFNKEVLEKAAQQGAQKVAAAFSTLCACNAQNGVSKVEIIPLKQAFTYLKPDADHAIVVYAQLLSGIPGTSLLTMSREQALALVDLLNKQPVGTTGIMKDIDRSAIKETLNILSNSYMTALSENAGIDLGLGVPHMISPDRIEEVVERLLEKGATEDDTAIIFEAELVIADHKISAKLLVVFNEKLAELIK